MERTILWLCLIGTVASLLYNAVMLIRRRRGGAPTPRHARGNVSGSMGMLFLFLVLLRGFDDPFSRSLLVASVALTVVSIALLVRRA